jgi:hypothetical protein
MFAINIPGSTLVEVDPEAAQNYCGRLPGTVSVTGYAQEYLIQQQASFPRRRALQTAVTLPARPPATRVQARFNLFKSGGFVSTATSLGEILGPERLRLSHYIGLII